jgi:hypothetical protein
MGVPYLAEPIRGKHHRLAPVQSASTSPRMKLHLTTKFARAQVYMVGAGVKTLLPEDYCSFICVDMAYTGNGWGDISFRPFLRALRAS